jgi:hypothetical protein
MKRRIAIGLLLVLHGFAHASVGVWAAYYGPLWLVTLLWGASMVGYLAAGFGVLRTPLLRDRWKSILAVATSASILLLLIYGDSTTILGIAVDVAIVVMAFGWAEPRIDAAVTVADRVGARGLPHPVWHRIAWSAAIATLVYATAVVFVRPAYLTWGSTAAERRGALPGDELVANPRYRVDHAITIHAPAAAVWPWLAQMGQDRGGFYSYDWLERLFGVDIRNANEIHPEWQRLGVGDLVRATQPGYLGGIFGEDLGWRVAALESGRAVVLQYWGAFLLEPIDTRTTRLIVRTRGDGAPSLLALVLGPLNVFVFEPAHFIMQREMLRGIRDRAERYATVAGEP